MIMATNSYEIASILEKEIEFEIVHLTSQDFGRVGSWANYQNQVKVVKFEVG